MTREEIIEQLNLAIGLIKQDGKDWLDDRDVPMLEECVKVLSQEPCEDAISRQAALDLIANYDLSMGQVVKGIHALPPVTQKSGNWVEIDDEPHEVWECDHCGFVIDGSGCIEPYEYRDIYKYCPNCGAKMESEDKVCKDCYYNDGEVHAECVICDKAESEEI